MFTRSYEYYGNLMKEEGERKLTAYEKGGSKCCEGEWFTKETYFCTLYSILPNSFFFFLRIGAFLSIFKQMNKPLNL